ncbi:MAG TPA: MBL fold metallo-hydrolase [Cellvibrionaceae bacterium]|nr:MBL fold metallo-hydrolase [Cellvibrionaceae bacterium]
MSGPWEMPKAPHVCLFAEECLRLAHTLGASQGIARRTNPFWSDVMPCSLCVHAAPLQGNSSLRRFTNDRPKPKSASGSGLRILWEVLFRKSKDSVPRVAIPVLPITPAQLHAAPNGSIYRLGHSTVLLKLRDKFWLTDPVFAERASPFKWFGPKRFHAPPITLKDLPPIEAVILSHNHYDHLDRAAVLALATKTQVFLTPTGVGDTLIKWGIDHKKVRQFAWWQGCEIAGIQFTATPAQHFSGRHLWDGNANLWASWVIVDGAQRLFFSGDTGYFAGFKTIGERFGPFDLTLLETGAYNKSWAYVHMQPEETIQAHLDLKGRWLLPIHNGTFDLSLHAWYEPFERICALATEANIPLATPKMGEALLLSDPQPGDLWWQELKA